MLTEAQKRAKKNFYKRHREKVIKESNERLKKKKAENPKAFRKYKAELAKKQHQKDKEKDLIRLFAYRRLRTEIILEREKCENCGNSENLEIHHQKYTNNKEDLRLLCRKCHLIIHRNWNKKKDLNLGITSI